MYNMVYGIDLGTTNSIIALKGKLITGLVPSIASVEKKTAGESLRNDYNAMRSFKRDISMEESGKPSIINSALVLKELVRIAKEEGHDVKDVVISVPHYFNDSQRAATKQAAQALKLNVRALINEPTAAAIALGKDIKGLIVVFDLGGGTFDVSIVDSRFGNYDVIATDGLPIGGDDLDRAIMRYINEKAGILPHRLGQEKLTQLLVESEKAKRHIVSTQTDYVLDISAYERREGASDEFKLTTRAYEHISRNVFKECVTKMKELISRYVDVEIDTHELILVGGSTRCPYLRKFVEDANGKPALVVSHNPDTVVAEGASLYAEMVGEGEDEYMVSDVTKALSIGLSDGTARVLVPTNSKLPFSTEVSITNSSDETGLLFDLYQGESVLAKNNEMIGQLRYKLDKVYEPGKFRGWAFIKIDKSGLINIGIREPLKTPVEIELER